MIKLSKKQMKGYLIFLNTFKSLVGFSDWSISIDLKTKEQGSTLATVGTDIYEKELHICLSDDFLKKLKGKQDNILMHELIHARIRYAYEKINEFRNIEEEHLVNDLTRGYETLACDTSIKMKK